MKSLLQCGKALTRWSTYTGSPIPFWVFTSCSCTLQKLLVYLTALLLKNFIISYNLIMMQFPLSGVVQHVQRSLWRILNGRQHVKLKRRLHSNLSTDFWHRVRPCDVMKMLFQKYLLLF